MPIQWNYVHFRPALTGASTRTRARIARRTRTDRRHGQRSGTSDRTCTSFPPRDQQAPCWRCSGNPSRTCDHTCRHAHRRRRSGTPWSSGNQSRRSAPSCRRQCACWSPWLKGGGGGWVGRVKSVWKTAVCYCALGLCNRQRKTPYGQLTPACRSNQGRRLRVLANHRLSVCLAAL